MKIKRLITTLLLFIILLTTTSLGIDIKELNETPDTTESTTSETSSENTDKLNLYSEAAILVENKTGKVLYGKNAEEKMYPASTTKILTAILAIEKGNLTDNVAVSKEAISGIPSGYSSAYLSEGEIISVENLLKVLLVHSANDAANVLAEYISGSIDDFVDLMNEKAKELGCENTNFVTTNGIHDDDHYSTAYDLATITRYCMQNETFRKFVSIQKCTIPATNKYQERIYTNTNDLINPSSEYYYENCIGVKTGYTSQAKNCLISACSKDGLQLIAVVLGASQQTETRKSARYVDSKALYDYGFSNYSISNIAEKSSVIDTIEIKNATSETQSLDLILEDDIKVLVRTDSQDNISYEINLNDDISAPIATNSVVGTITYTVDDIKYSKNLLASHDVVKEEIFIGIIRIALVIIILILTFVILSKKLRKKR